MVGRLNHIMALCCAALMLSGCAFAGMGGGGSSDTYDLAAPAVAKTNGRKAGVYIAVSQPSALRSLDTDQILVRDEQGKLSYFPSSSWGDRLPKLVQTRLVQALSDSGRFKAVGRSDDPVPGDVTLNIDLRSFNIQVNNGRAEAVVDVVAKIVDEKRDRIVATRKFAVSAPAAKDDAAAGVSALTDAFQRVSEQIIDWSANPGSA